MPRLRHLLLAPFLLATVPGAWAQSLQEVYEAARGYDAAYLAARAQAESAQHRKAQSEALRLPTVTATGSLTHTQTDPPSSLVNPGGNAGGATVTAVGVSGSQPLFNRANAATINQAERILEVSRADLQTAEQELIVRTAQTYFDVLVAQDTLAAAQASKTAIAEQLASAKRNFEVGTATITDTREAQARFDLATARRNRRRQRPARQTHRAGPIGRPRRRHAQAAGDPGGTAGIGPDAGRRLGDAGADRAPGRAQGRPGPGHRTPGNRQGPRGRDADRQRGRQRGRQSPDRHRHGRATPPAPAWACS